MSRQETLDALWHARATAILRTDDQDRAASAMAAAIRGGFRSVEFTLTTPGAYELITEFSRKHPDVVVGAGTVLEVNQVEKAVAAGAKFIVSPVTDPEVIQACSRLDAVAMPGTHTPTEMWLAHRAGADLCKLFPAPAGGPNYLRSILGPMAFLRIVPTNGVDAQNAADWIAAGAFAVGCVSCLFPADLLIAGDWSSVTARAGALLAAAGLPERMSLPPVIG